MNECCMKWKNGKVHEIFYDSGDISNTKLRTKYGVRIKFCPECGLDLLTIPYNSASILGEK